MRLVALVFAVFLLSCSSKNILSVDETYYQLLKHRLDSVGTTIDSVILECEEAMIDAGYFKNQDSKNYMEYIKLINESGEVDVPSWIISETTTTLLSNLNIWINVNPLSELESYNSDDSTSVVYKELKILYEIEKQNDISPKIVSESILKYTQTKDFDSPLYRLLFFKILNEVVVEKYAKGLQVSSSKENEALSNSVIKLDSEITLEIIVDAQGNLIVFGDTIVMSDLSKLTQSFLFSSANDSSENWSEIKKKIVSLKNQRGTSVQKYVSAYNEIIRAYNTIRDDVSMKKYGLSYNDLESQQKKEIRKIVPMRIAESEPIDF